MAGAEELQAIAEEFSMPIVSIEDVIRYRREREQLVHRVPGADAELPTHYGNGRVIGYRVDHETQEPVAFVFGDPTAVEAPLVRMHSSCLTGDLINSLRCDCGDQLEIALQRIGEERAGVLVYLPQEGREGYPAAGFWGVPVSALYWCDGKRSLAEVIRLTTLEMGPQNFDFVGYFKFLEKHGYVEFVQPKR